MMKLKSCFIFLLCSIQCLAQSDSTKRQLGLVPKIDILSPIAGLFTKTTDLGCSVEKEIGGHGGVQLTYSYFASITNPPSIDGGAHNTFYETQVIPEIRYYLGKAKRHEGVYIGASPEWVYTDQIYSETGPFSYYFHQHETQVAYGLDIGFKKYICKKIALDLLFGDGVTNLFYNAPFPAQYLRANLDVGYRF
ncbi:MAG: hypothetical protein ACLQQ4_14270 [Bacteroidia bacterium]